MTRVSRNRSLVAIAVAAVMTLALGLPVAADLNLVPGESAQVAYTNGDGINVRNYPGYGGAIVTTLHEGVEVTIVEGPMWLDDGTAWYQIAADLWDGYVEGWVIADYIAGEYVEPAQHSLANLTAGATAVVSGTLGEGLRLRDGASLDAGVMAVMPEGAVVTILDGDAHYGPNYTWSQVEYDGMTGYAASAYLSVDGSAPAAPDPVTEEPAAPVTEEPTADDGLTPGDRVAIAWTGGGGLNLRSEPNYNASVMTVVPEGHVATIVDGPSWDGSGNGWYQVDYSSMVGWVHGGYLAWTDQEPTTDPTLGSVDQPVEDPAPSEPDPAPQPEPEPDPDQTPVAAVTGVGAAIVAEALNYVGTPYVWGGTTPSGFDCSGFTYYIVNKVAGIGLSRSLEVQAVSGSYVAPENLLPGDLVFQQNTYKWGLSHVGIYIGGGQMVNAQSERVGTAIADIWDSYWGPRYYTARRVA